MKNQSVIEFLAFFIASYLLISSFAFIGGMLSVSLVYANTGCYSTPSKIGNLFPAYRFGCYVTSPINQEYYDYHSLKKHRSENDN